MSREMGEAAPIRGWPEVAVSIGGKPVRVGSRTAEIVRQLVEHQCEFEGAVLPHGDLSFRLASDRVKMAITKVMPARPLASDRRGDDFVG